uniref:NADH-ubiquinone oxidoreductase chain 1 n=1 Tax=Granata lyrata TaxID=479586 RepID=A0A0S1F5M7_GRALY|nr:NADH dehydrogenase subunit 1 [Granata lyrata]ALK03372.1 NADH dehydrogenase subunit 1 [Granata lyrata]
MLVSAFLSCIMTFVCVLVGVAFFTLLERKGLGYFQIRKGPNKVGLAGLPQPLADAVKLFVKELTKPNMANYLAYYMAPVLSLCLALVLWELYPGMSCVKVWGWGVLMFLCVSSLSVYGTLIAGWASNSKYALLGAVRAVAQTISYEVSLALIIMFSLLVSGSFDFNYIMELHGYVWLTFLLWPVGVIWFVSCIAETNRAPFDFAEGESELVSGFNVEYGAGSFALIFMAEYANILVMSLFSSVLFFGGSSFVVGDLDFVLVLKTLFFSFMFIWVRASYPRFRYDFLMGLTWKGFLPLALGGLILVSGVFSLFSVIDCFGWVSSAFESGESGAFLVVMGVMKLFEVSGELVIRFLDMWCSLEVWIMVWWFGGSG